MVVGRLSVMVGVAVGSGDDTAISEQAVATIKHEKAKRYFPYDAGMRFSID